MTGPEHHREAERLLELAREAGIQRAHTHPTRFNIGGAPDLPDYGKFYANESSDPKCRNLLADAQIHALLAVAAALEAPQVAVPPVP